MWGLALSLSVNDAVINRIPLDLKSYNGSVMNYVLEELRFLPNRTYWEQHREIVYSFQSDQCQGDYVQLCASFGTPSHDKIAEIFYFCICYVIPTMIMVFCYGEILRILLKRKIVIGSVDSEVSRTARRRQAVKNRHIMIIAALVSTYVALLGPHQMYSLYLRFHRKIDLSSNWIVYVLKLLTYLCTILNPIIYMFSTVITSRSSRSPSNVYSLSLISQKN